MIVRIAALVAASVHGTSALAISTARRLSISSFPSGQVFGPPGFTETDKVEFGTTVQLDGSLLAVGAPLRGINVYDSNFTTIWTHAGDGERFSLSGELIAVRYASSVGVYNISSGTQIGANITISVKASSITLSDRTLLLGLDAVNNFYGRCVFYELVNRTWVQKIQGDALTPSSRHGWATAIGVNVSVVSAPNSNTGPYSRVGAVAAYQRLQDGSWGYHSVYFGTQVDEQFGFSLDLSTDDTTVVVGSPNFADKRGKVSVFTLGPLGWNQVGQDILGDVNDRFGRAVSVNADGTRIAASSFYHLSQRGIVRSYELVEGAWTLVGELEGSASLDRLGYGTFGLSISNDGYTVAAGSVWAKNKDGFASGKVDVVKFPLTVKTTPSPSATPSQITTTSTLPQAPTLLPTPILTTYPTSVLTTILPTATSPNTPPATTLLPTFTPSANSTPAPINAQAGTDQPSTQPSSFELVVPPKLYQVGTTIARSDNGFIGSSDFGSVVTLASASGERLAVGAPGFDGPGGVFIYELINGGIWDLIWSSRELGVGDRLSISGDGSRVALRDNDSVVKVYNIDTGALVGNPITVATAGETVSLSPDGSILAVSEESFKAFAGRVSLFHFVGEDWTPLNSLFSQDSQSRFGWITSFSEDGSLLAISAPNYDQDGIAKRGLVRLFKRRGLTYAQIGVDLLGTQANEQFGFSLALGASGDVLIVGSPKSNGSGSLRGKAAVFHYINDEWIQVGDDISGEFDNDYSGRSVVISQSGLRVGITSLYHNAQRGHLRVFDLVENVWVLVGEVEGSGSGARLGFGNFGLSMTSDGSRVAVGSLVGLDSSEGQVQVFDFEASDETSTSIPVASPTTTTTPSSEASKAPTVVSLSPTIAPSGKPSFNPSRKSSSLTPSTKPTNRPTSKASSFPTTPSTSPNSLPHVTIHPSVDTAPRTVVSNDASGAMESRSICFWVAVIVGILSIVM